MARVPTVITAALLTLVVAVGPVLLDECAGVCETHGAAVLNAPACHHDDAVGVRIGRVPGPCGHHHQDLAVAAVVKNPSPSHDVSGPAIAIDSARTALASPAAGRRLDGQSPPGSLPPHATRSLPLRI